MIFIIDSKIIKLLDNIIYGFIVVFGFMVKYEKKI